MARINWENQLVSVDVGASQMIIDGKIKLKNDSMIKEFTATGLKFEDGSELSADVIMFATGYFIPLIMG
jgi:NAD(P)H-nitrite reductase large subunit